MGSIIGAIHDDMDEYEDLCKKYKEMPEYKSDSYGNKLLDCYGVHAESLKRRQEENRKALKESKK